MRIENDLAYVLHCTPYRDNSAIAHILTKENGKVSFIINGIKNAKSSKRALLQPCRKLQFSYTLKSNLSTLSQIESRPTAAIPAIDDFMLYQYVHELLLVTLPNQLPVDNIFIAYEAFLQQLTDKQKYKALRYLEIALIEQFLGLPNLAATEDTHKQIVSKHRYYFYPDKGLFSHPQSEHGISIDGANILAFQHLIEQPQEHITEALAQGAQPLTTFLIKQLLNGKTLKTKTIFQALNNYLA